MEQEIEVEEDGSGPGPASGSDVEKLCHRCHAVVTHKYRVKIGNRYYCKGCYRTARTKKKLRGQLKKLRRPALIALFMALLAYFVYRHLEKEGASMLQQATESQ